jgi:hypothetical protein
MLPLATDLINIGLNPVSVAPPELLLSRSFLFTRGNSTLGNAAKQKKEPLRPSMDRSGLWFGPKLDPTGGMLLHSEAAKSLLPKQARQESNLQPPVLETGALPIELRT